jgi:hypothetical protein
MKKLLIIAAAALCALAFAGCAKKVVHCDGCGKEIKLPANSNMTEDWIVLCDECKSKVDNAVVPRD